jgi:hypothetical protein
MLIQVLRQTMLAGRVVRVGDVLEASPTDAKLLIGIGKAIQTVKAAVETVEAIKPEPASKPQPPRRRTKP